jgi:transcriptional regulator GlxA family with amidase domain
LRVERARVLLLTTSMPLRAIAPLVGFRDEFQLSRVFRQVAGHPPSALVRAL